MSATVSDHRTFHIIEAVAGLLEGAPRQMWRHRSSDFKAQAVAETVQPGASVSAVARGLGVDPSQLFTWPSGRTTDYSGARLQQARYDATLAERRYATCDPDNRLLAAQLEKNWEAALQRVEECRSIVSRAYH